MTRSQDVVLGDGHHAVFKSDAGRMGHGGKSGGTNI